jgi:hypothetical protein
MKTPSVNILVDFLFRSVDTSFQLVLNDGSSPAVDVARYNRKLLTAKDSYLEIFPAGEHMVDEILVTFIYIERLRTEESISK